MMKVAVTGGIGSGKSSACRLFEERGVAVYNSDRRAKELIATKLRDKIIELFGDEAFIDNQLNRSFIASQVFNNAEQLARLNAVVHPAVMEDFADWSERQTSSYVILESAILYESHLESCVDKVIGILAPRSLRIERVIKRDGCTAEEVEQRMANQLSDDELHSRADHTIANIFEEDLAPAVLQYDQMLNHEARKQKLVE